MDPLLSLMDAILHLDRHIEVLVQSYGGWVYAILFLIVFCETGFVALPFLPGDSLLFVAGAIAGAGALDPVVLSASLLIAAIAGDAANYYIGRRTGLAAFDTRTTHVFKHTYLMRTQAFYKRRGEITILVARFLPVIRTFAPFVAGIDRMHYGRFTAYNVFGAVAWVGILVGAGYLLGDRPWVQQHLSLVILLSIVAAFVPLLVEAVRQQRLTWWTR